jgi:hypothetical protein
LKVTDNDQLCSLLQYEMKNYRKMLMILALPTNMLKLGSAVYRSSDSDKHLLMRLCQPLDGSTSPKYKLLCF